MVLSSILDPVQPTLSPYLWDHPEAPEPVLKPKHAAFIKQHIYGALERHGYANPHEWLRLCVTGSLTTYQYADDSDCDISLFVNSAALPEWSRGEMIGIMIGEVDGTILPGTPYPLQDFVVGRHFQPGDLYQRGLRSGYDIDANRWIVPPEKDRSHDTESAENGFYAYALQMADKMDRLLRYEPDKATRFWHQIHKRRMADQKMGKGDFSESNIIYKFLSKRGLFPRLEELTGEHIASGESPFAVTVRTMRRDGFSDQEIDSWADYLAAHNEADRDSGELDDVPDEQVERWYENWESDGRPRLGAYTHGVGPTAESWTPVQAKTAGVAAPIGDEAPAHTERVPDRGQASQLAQQVYDATLKDGGITVSLDGSRPEAGFAYSPYKGGEAVIPAQSFDPSLVDRYVHDHAADLQQPGHYLGVWVADGHVYLDISIVEPDQQRATAQAAGNGQRAIYDLTNFNEIPVAQAA